jgi:DNA polymerase I-like protein with 3'-5' exonuclease and polymerase domains
LDYSVLDCETTSSNNGNPYDSTNHLKITGLFFRGEYSIFDMGFSGLPYQDSSKILQTKLDESEFIVGFNPKFDIAWLRNNQVYIRRPIWDCQYAEYVLSGQKNIQESLEDICLKHGLGEKIQIDWTKEPTKQELEARVTRDLELTNKLFLHQLERIKDNKQLKTCIWWGCQDQLVTQEMEWNGIKYDLELSKKLGKELSEIIVLVDRRLFDLLPYDNINFGSHEHISAFIYGGIAKYKKRVIVTKTLKSGKESSREVWREFIYEFPRLCEPIEGSELKKTGYFSTDEKTLRTIKTFGKAKKIIDALLERAKLQKKVSTYFEGIPNTYETYHWLNGLIHGQFIHCRTRTGRLSSSTPNLQNIDEDVRKCIITRFPKI